MVTIKEIAAAVGVSSATVSRVLNYDSTLSISNRKRQAIIETAEALNYATPRNRNRANQQGLNKVALVHFLAPERELVDPYYVALRLGIERRCAALKIETVKVYHTDARPDAKLLQEASGTIVIGRHDEDEIDWLQKNSRHGKALGRPGPARLSAHCLYWLGRPARPGLRAVDDGGRLVR
jgi:LacI family transcriptional regulator